MCSLFKNTLLYKNQTFGIVSYQVEGFIDKWVTDIT